jgi:poly-beta-1,6-N-acetyl-D-glucosamine synthase
MAWESILFWSAGLLLAYTYAGYPLVIWLAGRLSGGRKQVSASSGRAYEPDISILVIGHNEASRIADRIENLLALDYPAHKREIVIASDASSDATVERALRYKSEGVRVVSFSKHRGKPAVLNDMIPRLSGEIVVLMDVRQRVKPDALRAMLRNFTDPTVGAVSGELFLLDGDIKSDVGDGVGFYWRYEKFIRSNESRVDSTVGVTGAIYAIRHCLFHPIPEETILDDVLIPMQIVRRGYRVLFESAAHAYDRVSATAQAEFIRKVRTIAGNYQLFVQQPWLLNPWMNRLWFQTLSHKFLRLLGPLLLATVFISNALMLESGFYQLLFVLQLCFYGAALLGQLIPGSARKSAIVGVAHAFCLLNFATLMGFTRFISGRQRVTWKKVTDGAVAP